MLAVETDYATAPGTNKPLILPFGKHQYLVPRTAIKSMAKRSNEIKDGPAKLSSILHTKSPPAWEEYLHPDVLIKISGSEGSYVYTTFSVEGHEDEVRILRLVASGIAEKGFAKWREKMSDVEPTNDKQRRRIGVLDWTKEADCPSRAQISPELNGWPTVLTAGVEGIATCDSKPPSKKRTLKAGDAGGGNKKAAHSSGESGQDDESEATVALPEGVAWQRSISVGAPGTFTISQIRGRVLITQFEVADDVPDAGDGVEA